MLPTFAQNFLNQYFDLTLSLGLLCFALGFGNKGLYASLTFLLLLPTPGEAKAKAMPGRLYIHTKINNNK